MANIFEDIGRSGAAVSVREVPRLAIELGKMNLQAAQQRAGFAIDLEKLAMAKREEVRATEKHKMDMEAAAKNARILEEQAQEAERAGRWKRGRVNPAILPQFAQLPPDSQKQLMADWKSSGELDAEGTVSRQGLLDTLHQMNTSTEYFAKILRTPLILQADQEAAAAIEELGKEREKGAKANPDKIAELQANVKATAQKASALRGQMDKALEDVKLEEEWERKKQELNIKHRQTMERIRLTGDTKKKTIDVLTQTMAKLASAERALFLLEKTGGISPVEMEILKKSNSDMAMALSGGDKTSATNSLKALIKRYSDIIAAAGGGGYYNQPGIPQKSEWEQYNTEME